MSEAVEWNCKECEADNCLCTCHLTSGETVRFSNEDLAEASIKITEFIASGELIALIPEGVDAEDFNKGVRMLPELILDLQDSRKGNSELIEHTAALWVIAHTLREHLNEAQLDVLSATPTQSLIEHDKTIRNKAIRECAAACESVTITGATYDTQLAIVKCAEAIEGLLGD